MSKNDTIETQFRDAVFKDVPMTGANVRDTNGLDIRDGMGGTAREMPEVTRVNIRDDDAPGRDGGSAIKGS